MVSRFLSWLLTDTGKTFVGGATIAASCLSYVGYILPHTFLMYKYQEIVQLYRNGFEYPVPPDLLARAKQVVDELNVHPERKEDIRFFNVYGFDLFLAGSTMLQVGAIIGLPANFMYKTTKDVERMKIQVGFKPVPWDAEHGQALMESLVLGENAQRAGIARQIYLADNNGRLYKSTIPSIMIILVYMANRAININFGLYIRPRSLRMGVYTLMAGLGTGMWLVINDAISVAYDRWVDDRVAQLGEPYITGSIDLYQKLLSRNRALRTCLGDEGPKQYSFYGNEESVFRTKTLPLTQRLDYFKEKLQELRKCEELIS